MNVVLSAPSKTFLTGEYAVLVGGPALILNTQPRFELRARQGAGESVAGIPAGSPAAAWLDQRAPLLQDWHLQFVDPHEGRGGFGASGAQFALAHSLTTLMQSDWSVEKLDPLAMWNDYQVITRKTGSGADLLAQFSGQVARVDMSGVRAEARAWPYPDLSFVVLRTGSKLPTHLHLQNLKRETLAGLEAPARKVADAFGRMGASEFCALVRAYTSALCELKLQCERTQELLRPFGAQPWCWAAKGCGAWGADTILVLFPTEERARVQAFCAGQGLEIAATELSEGVKVVKREN